MKLARFSAGKYWSRFGQDLHDQDGDLGHRRHVRGDLRSRLVAGIAVLQAGVGVWLRIRQHRIVTILTRDVVRKGHCGRCIRRDARLRNCQCLCE